MLFDPPSMSIAVTEKPAVSAFVGDLGDPVLLTARFTALVFGMLVRWF